MIPKTVVLLDEAISDLDSGKIFYRAHGDWLANHFINSLIADAESLALLAGVHAKKWGVYRALSKRFPFAIYYEVNSNNVFVIAVLDMRRDPAQTQKTLTKRNPRLHPKP